MLLLLFFYFNNSILYLTDLYFYIRTFEHLLRLIHEPRINQKKTSLRPSKTLIPTDRHSSPPCVLPAWPAAPPRSPSSLWEETTPPEAAEAPFLTSHKAMLETHTIRWFRWKEEVERNSGCPCADIRHRPDKLGAHTHPAGAAGRGNSLLSCYYCEHIAGVA